MYKVLIAEDEQWIVENLKVAVDWESLGLQVAATALDGVEALEKIQACGADIVITDIRMPGMDGLELMNRARRAGRDVEFIVISGFAEFAYAQKAMSYGAAGYCLKPLEESEITRMLVKIIERLDARRGPSTSDEELLALAEDPGREACERIRGIFRVAGLRAAEGIVAVGSIGEGTVSPSRGQRRLECRLGVRKRVCFLAYNPRMSLSSHLAPVIPPDVRGIGLGGVYRENGPLMRYIEAAVIAAYQFFTTGLPGVFEAEEGGLPPAELAELFSRLQRELQRQDAAAVRRTLDETGALFKAGRLTIVHAYRIYNLIYSVRQGVAGSAEEEYAASFEKLAGIFESAAAMVETLKEYVSVGLGMRGDSAPSGVTNETVKSIMKYIRDNFLRDLSLQALSEQFLMSPGYLSHLIRKEGGTSFLEYLTGLRMDFARELLRTTRLSVNSIAEKCGYDDYLYFRRIFKRSIGKTPTEYRESIPSV